MRTASTGFGVHPATDSDTLAFWPFDFGSGASAFDIFGGRTLSNTTGKWSLGLTGGSLFFVGAGGVNTTGAAGADAAALQGQVSFEMWVQVGGAPAATSSMVEYSNPGGGAGAADHIQFGLQLNADLTFKWIWEGAATQQQNSTAKLRVGTWQHIAVTKADDGAGSFTVSTYLNGVLDNTKTTVAAPTGGGNGQWYFGTGKGGNFTGMICSAHLSDAGLVSTHYVSSWRRGMLWTDPSTSGPGIDELQVTVTPSWSGGAAFLLSSYLNTFDFVQSVDLTESIDQQCMTAKLMLKRAVYGISLSPLITESPANQNPQPSSAAPGPASSAFAAVLHIGAQINIYARRRPSGTDDSLGSTIPLPSGELIFQGAVDSLDFSSGTIEIQCRDSGALLVDTYIETEADYNTAGDQSIEATIQAIFTAAGTGVTLYTPTTPGFMLGEFRQRRESTMQAAQTKADQIGWITKYRWDPMTNAFRFTLYDPERERQRFDGVVTDIDYSEIGGLSYNIKDVRNAVRVAYRNSLGEATGVDDNGNDIFPPAAVVVTDPASITAYGRRFMEISDAACPNIDTSAEATAMANAILNDLSTPQLFMDLDIPFWEIEVGDRLKFSENAEAFDTPQTLAVLGRHVKFTKGFGTTSLQLKETPASARNKHLVKEAGEGRSLPPCLDPADAPTDTGIRGRYAPLENLYNIDPGFGQITPSLAGLQNPAFLTHPRGVAGIPTGWNHGSGVWGSGGDVYFTNQANSGNRAVTLINVGATVQSRWMPVIGGRVYEGRVVWTGAGATDQLQVELEFYDVSRTLRASSVLFNSVVTTPLTYQTSRGVAASAPTDRWARVKCTKMAGPPISIDRIQIDAMCEGFHAVMSGPSVIAAGTNTLKWDAEIFDYGGIYDPVTGLVEITEPGFYRFHAYAYLTAVVTSSLTGAFIDLKANIPGVGTVVMWSSSYLPSSGVTSGDLWLHTPPTNVEAGWTLQFDLTIPANCTLGAQSSGAGNRDPLTDR